jgi:hypothetical protein
VHESTCFESVVANFIASRKKRRRKKPMKLAADKAYSVQRIRDWLKQQRIFAVIPHKDNGVTFVTNGGRVESAAE